MQFAYDKDQTSIIKVIGVGGGGTNAVNHMMKGGIIGVDFAICNTDQQSLEMSAPAINLKLVKRLVKSLLRRSGLSWKWVRKCSS